MNNSQEYAKIGNKNNFYKSRFMKKKSYSSGAESRDGGVM